MSLENIVYNELLIKGYEVFIGKTRKSKIDFITQKLDKKIYIQVSYTLSDEQTLKREVDAYKGIEDNYTKYIISLDKANFSTDGVININFFDFINSEEI